MSLDKKDKLILQLLQDDSTMSVKEISEKIGLTFTPTYERIKNLEKQGVIEKYVAILNREKLGINIVVYCNVRLKEQSQKRCRILRITSLLTMKFRKLSVSPANMIICSKSSLQTLILTILLL